MKDMSYAEIQEQYPIGLVLDLAGRYMVGGNRYKKAPKGAFAAIRTDQEGLAKAEEACKASRARTKARQGRNPNLRD